MDCPHCGAALESRPTGSRIKCPVCDGVFVVGHEPPTTTYTPPASADYPLLRFSVTFFKATAVVLPLFCFAWGVGTLVRAADFHSADLAMIAFAIILGGLVAGGTALFLSGLASWLLDRR